MQSFNLFTVLLLTASIILVNCLAEDTEKEGSETLMTKYTETMKGIMPDSMKGNFDKMVDLLQETMQGNDQLKSGSEQLSKILKRMTEMTGKLANAMRGKED